MQDYKKKTLHAGETCRYVQMKSEYEMDMKIFLIEVWLPHLHKVLTLKALMQLTDLTDRHSYGLYQVNLGTMAMHWSIGR